MIPIHLETISLSNTPNLPSEVVLPGHWDLAGFTLWSLLWIECLGPHKMHMLKAYSFNVMIFRAGALEVIELD